TRSKRDWSSDVCSSDLPLQWDGYHSAGRLLSHTVCECHCGLSYILPQLPGRWLIRRSTAVSNAVPCRRNDCRWGKEPPRYFLPRSEERRVGKEYSSDLL